MPRYVCGPPTITHWLGTRLSLTQALDVTEPWQQVVSSPLQRLHAVLSIASAHEEEGQAHHEPPASLCVISDYVPCVLGNQLCCPRTYCCPSHLPPAVDAQVDGVCGSLLPPLPPEPCPHTI